MGDFSGLQSLTQMFDRIEQGLEQVKLTVLSRDHQQQILNEVKEGLAKVNITDQNKIKVETRTGEYVNEIAIFDTGKNKYTISLDHQGVYISELNRYACRVMPDAFGMLVYHQDSPGVVHEVTRTLADQKLNIYSMNLSREQKGKNALLVLLTDENIAPNILSTIQKLPRVDHALSI